MKLFISWSGDRSRAVAEALRDWLPDVIQSVDAWISSQDINAGARWSSEISEQLSETKFGVLCLTRENQEAPWILFEAGALAKTLRDAFVVPYLVDLQPSDLQGPLTQFQAQQRDRDGTWELVRSVNASLGKDTLPEARLKRIFDRMWPELEEALEQLPESSTPTKAARSEKEILREVLELVRTISKRSSNLLTREDLTATFGFSERLFPNRVRHPSMVLHPTLRSWKDVDISEAEREAAREDLLVEEAEREAAREDLLIEDAIEKELHDEEAREEAAYQAALAAEQVQEDHIESDIEDEEARDPNPEYDEPER